MPFFSLIFFEGSKLSEELLVSFYHFQRKRVYMFFHVTDECRDDVYNQCTLEMLNHSLPCLVAEKF